MLKPLLFSLLLIPAQEAFAGPTGQLALPGQYHGDEMPLQDAHSWLGLYETPQGLLWRSTAPQFKPTVDPVTDRPGEETGVEVAVPGQTPLLLVRGVPALHPGAATRAPVARQALTPGSNVALTDGLHLQATTDSTGAYALALVGADGRAQVLCTHAEMSDDTVPTLMLAGDLDGDGRLDLLIDLSNHYNVSRVTLFLSSAAGKNEWVSPVASLETTGC